MRDIDNSLGSIPPEHRINMGNLINDFLGNIAKEKMLEQLPKDDICDLFNILRIISLVPPSYLENASKSDEFKHIYRLLQQSITTNSISNELNSIYDTKIQGTLKILRYKQLKTIRPIMGNQYENFKNIRKNNKAKAKEFFKKRLSEAPEEIAKKYKFLDPNDHHLLFVKLSMSLLQTKIKDDDFLKYIAFLIQFPEHQIINFDIYFDEWDEFPLKWYFQFLPINIGKDIFLHYREDKSCLDDFFSQIYEVNKFEKIKSFFDSAYLKPPIMHILCGRTAVIEEVLACYELKYYSAVVCVALTIIEGLLWDFSLFIHQKEKNIYTDIEEGNINLNFLCKRYTIGHIIKNTDFKNKLYVPFIDYFCDELYNERNPILHGNNTNCFTQVNAAKKIATIEHILNMIDNYSKQAIKNYLEKNIPIEAQEHLKEQAFNILYKKNIDDSKGG